MKPKARRCSFVQPLTLSMSTSSFASTSSSCASSREASVMSMSVHDTVDTNIHRGYIVHKRILGDGQFGKVRLATHLKTLKMAAIKVVNKNKFLINKQESLVRKEIDSLKQLKHPNIARLLQLIEDRDHIFIITEVS